MQHLNTRSKELPRFSFPHVISNELIAPGAFVGAILFSNYLLSAVPNVKLFDLLVFVAGYTLGLRRGISVAIAAWLVYGNINPWGIAHVQLLVTLMASESLFAVAGAVTRKLLTPGQITLGVSKSTLAFVTSAALVTLIYDLVTNAYTGYFWATIAGSDDYGRWLMLGLFNPGALFFMAVHAGANLAFFPVFGPLFIKGAAWAKEHSRWG